MAKQYPGLRRYTRSDEPAAVIGEPCYMVVMLDWHDMGALEATLGSVIAGGPPRTPRRTLASCATFRGMILQLERLNARLPLRRKGAPVVEAAQARPDGVGGVATRGPCSNVQD